MAACAATTTPRDALRPRLRDERNRNEDNKDVAPPLPTHAGQLLLQDPRRGSSSLLARKGNAVAETPR